MRLIDADVLIEDIGKEIDMYKKVFLSSAHCAGMRIAISIINSQDTINNVKHGHWEESKCLDDCFWVCSCCKFPSQAIAAPKLYKYCPNCGARMDMKDE